MNATERLAIVHNVETSHRVIAVCSVRTYDVWGNSGDGFEVNDTRSAGQVEITCRATVSNFPLHPGAKDAYRSFPEAGSFSCEVAVSFTPSDKDIRRVLGYSCAIETDGDDTTIYVNRARDGRPLCELRIESWRID